MMLVQATLAMLQVAALFGLSTDRQRGAVMVRGLLLSILRSLSRPALALLLLSGLGLTASTASADPTSSRRFYLEAGQITVPTDDTQAYTQLGFRTSNLDARAPSIDFAMSALVVPAALLVGDLDVAWPIPFGQDVRIVPRAGVSGIVLAVPGFGGAVPGVNVGVGLAFTPDAPVSFRADFVNRQVYGGGSGRSVYAQTLSVGLSWW